MIQYNIHEEENYLDQLNYMKYTIVIFNLIKIRSFTYFPLLICHDMDDLICHDMNDLKVPHSCHEYIMILYIYIQLASFRPITLLVVCNAAISIFFGWCIGSLSCNS
jgi:hypothetical protein